VCRRRVRFSTGTLLFAVAVVAANVAGFRHFYETGRYGAGRFTYRILPEAVGVVPLVNVALVGALLFGARRVRSLLRGGEAGRKPPVPGLVYFGLHFLLLGVLVDRYLPETFDGARAALECAQEYAAGRWARVFGDPGGTVPWVAFDSLMLGAVVSGPPLLLAGVGGALARHSAATLPRRRFLALAGLVEFGFAAAALAVCLTPTPFEDEQEVALDFRVVDESSGRPVAAAFVCVTDPFSLDPAATPPRALTDRDGRARLTGRFVVRGDRNAFRALGHFSPWGRWLEVSAAGRRTRRVPLPDVLGASVDPDRPVLRTIALTPGATRDAPFRDLAGVYQGVDGWSGGQRIAIEPDGRFALSAWGCVPPDFQEYGYLKRHGEEIELLPIPHPGRADEPLDDEPLTTLRYRAVPWGDRLYLLFVADPAELRDLCRAALTPNRPSTPSEPCGPFLLRHPHRAGPPTGLPRLPLAAWASFLADELSRNRSTSHGDLPEPSPAARSTRADAP